MIAAYVCAGISFAAMVLYALRAGHAWKKRYWPERLMALAIAQLLGFLAVAFVDVAHNQDSLLWRQWLVFAALTFLAGALAWPRKRKDRTHRTF